MIDGFGGMGPGDAAGPPPARRGGRPIGPEIVAALLAAIVVAIVGGGVLAGGPTTIPSPTAAGPTRSPIVFVEPTPSIDLAAIATCLEIDARLEADKIALASELAASTFEQGDVQTILRGINADVIVASAVAGRLLRLPASAAVGTTMTTYYAKLHKRTSDALANSIQFAAAYRTAAISVSAILAELPPLDAMLVALRDGATSASAAPSGAIPSGSIASASPPPSPSATPPPIGSPAVTPPPSASAGVVNPGFESGVGSPWELVLTATGSASITADGSVHADGIASARIDISAAGVERAAVAVRQGGLSIEAGSHYVATIWARAAAAREVRLRIASAAGDTYATRLFTVGPEWQALTVDSTVFATDLNAYLEVDLGRFAATTWLDDASFIQVAASGG